MERIYENDSLAAITKMTSSARVGVLMGRADLVAHWFSTFGYHCRPLGQLPNSVHRTLAFGCRLFQRKSTDLQCLLDVLRGDRF